MDSVALSEQLMRRGWWDEAAAAIDNPDVQAADKTLQSAALYCRRACCQWAAMQDESINSAELERLMLTMFDSYTVYWYFKYYTGEGSVLWRKSAREKGLTD